MILRQTHHPDGALMTMIESDRELHDRFLRLFMGQEQGLRVFVRSLLFSQEEEREVMQEVAVVLWRKFDPAMDDAAFTRWAFGVARMEALAFRRDRARDRHLFGDEVFELLAQTTADHAETLEAERRALEVCVEKLPREQRELLRTAYAPGVRMDALAERLGRTAMSLYKSLHRIRITLMECTQRELAKEELA
jgi:RNA polymerase sigma-70 factor (ECF subfamily)